MSGLHEYPEKDKSWRIQIKHPSIIAPFSDLCVWTECLLWAFFPWRKLSDFQQLIWTVSGSLHLSTCAVSNRHCWSGHLAHPAPHPHATRSLISSYLAPGMQPLILKNTLSCNILEKPRSTLKKNGTPLCDLLICTLKKDKREKDWSYFGVIWRNMASVYAIFLCFSGLAVIYVQKKANLGQGLHRAVMLSTGSQYVGALHHAC